MAEATSAAWREWPQEQIDLIKKTVAKDATNAELYHFLNLAARYDLDPFAKEIWFSKSAGRNGGAGQLLLMVGRDGLRKIAHKSGLGLDGDVVRENDTFTVRRDPETRKRTIEHAYTEARHERDAKDEQTMTAAETSRGRIIGAWAEVYDKETGEARGYFYAHMSEFRPTNERKLQYSPWGSQESIMILAAAERTALRIATPLSGLLAEGETDLNMQLLAEGERVEAEAIEYPEGTSDEMIERLSAAFDRGNELETNAYSPAQVQMLIGGRDEQALTLLAEEVEAENVERERRAEEEASAAFQEDRAEGGENEFDGVDDAELRKQLESLDPADDEQAARGIAIEDELRVRGGQNVNQGNLLDADGPADEPTEQ